MKQIRLISIILIILMIPITNIGAQETESTVVIPRAYRLQNVRYEAQGWNNCGPATLTNALSYFGYQDNQTRAANWLKPNYEDKNVSPWQMVEFVNTQVSEIPVYALQRTGGDEQLLKVLLYNNFPVIIEEGYDPDPVRFNGWMGHYLLLIGYDDSVNVFTTHDSFAGAQLNYTYDHINEFWQHFNRTYIVLYTSNRQEELMTLLGDDADEWQNSVNSLEQARLEATANPNDNWAWFNMGTNFAELGMYNEAATAYDRAFELGMPWRTLWYQFGPYEAYHQTGRYQDMITLAQSALNDGGGHFVEETYYYGGLAREELGELQRAVNNYNEVLLFNPNFEPAREARDRVLQKMNNS